MRKESSYRANPLETPRHHIVVTEKSLMFQPPIDPGRIRTCDSFPSVLDIYIRYVQVRYAYIISPFNMFVDVEVHGNPCGKIRAP